MKKKLWLISIAAFACIVATMAFYLIIYASNEFSYKIDEWSGFGNFVGGTLSPLLDFLALIALLYNIDYQIAEFDKTNRHLSDQNNLLQKQSVEATYFHLLKLLNQTVKGISIKISTGNLEELSFENKEAFQELVRQLNYIKDSNPTDSNEEKYKKFKKKYEGNLSHYYELITIILRFIDDNSYLSDQEKNTYASILRAQFSIYEQVIISHNLEFGNEIDSFLIKKYQIICNSSEKFVAAAGIKRSNV